MLLFGVTYGLIATFNSFLSSSPLGVIALAALVVVGSSLMVMPTRVDNLEPIRWVGLLFILTYGLAPLFLTANPWHVRGAVEPLIAEASVYALAALLAIAAGYYVPLYRHSSSGFRKASLPSTRGLALTAGCVLIGLGLASYMAALVSAGGLERVISGGESRVQFFKGFGYLYHATFLMLPGGALVFCASTFGRRRIPWLASSPLVAAFLLLLLLQGRFRSFRSLATLGIATHYRVRAIRPRLIISGVLVLLLVFLFVGYARNPSVRYMIVADPGALLHLFRTDLVAFASGTFGEAGNRLLQLILIFDHFPDSRSYYWGATLFVVINPYVRLLGLHHLQFPSVGTDLFHLANPEAPAWIETGLHPSLVGEMIVNFTPAGAFLGLLLYGMLLRFLYERLVLRADDYLSVALYSVILFPILSMIIVGVGQMFFELATIALPVILLRSALRSNRPVPQREYTDTPVAEAEEVSRSRQ